MCSGYATHAAPPAALHRTLVGPSLLSCILLFFFNDTATTEIYTLSLHDALPIYASAGRNVIVERECLGDRLAVRNLEQRSQAIGSGFIGAEHSKVFRLGVERKTRSEEHTSELQSLTNLVCRLLLEKKKKNKNINT